MLLVTSVQSPISIYQVASPINLLIFASGETVSSYILADRTPQWQRGSVGSARDNLDIVTRYY